MEGRRKPLEFVNPEKGPTHYVRRYLNEPEYKAWFDRNYPDHTIYEGIGISEQEFLDIARGLAESETEKAPEATDGLAKLSELAERLEREAAEEETAPALEEKEKAGEEKEEPPAETEGQPSGEDIARSVFSSHPDERSGYDRRTFEEFVDERVLISRDLFGKKEMKIKILEVSDEHQESKIRWKFGDRVKVNKIIVTIKHLDSMEVEEGEFDIEAIERELAEKRHYSSTNRWIPSADIKNGYVVNSKHTALISDAVALDYIVF